MRQNSHSVVKDTLCPRLSFLQQSLQIVYSFKVSFPAPAPLCMRMCAIFYCTIIYARIKFIQVYNSDQTAVQGNDGSHVIIYIFFSVLQGERSLVT